jgi:hypothetical protein
MSNFYNIHEIYKNLQKLFKNKLYSNEKYSFYSFTDHSKFKKHTYTKILVYTEFERDKFLLNVPSFRRNKLFLTIESTSLFFFYYNDIDENLKYFIRVEVIE